MSAEHSKLTGIVNDASKRARKDQELFPCFTECADTYCVTQKLQEGYPSIQYSVLLHENQPLLDDDEELLIALGGRRLDVEFYVSLLGDYYYYFAVETIKDAGGQLRFNVLADDQIPFENMKLITSLKSKLSSLGYKLLERSIAYEIVPNVETELKYTGEVTIFSCLFSDMLTKY
jgi:hypothetical protein